MTTASTSTVVDHSTDAAFRTWVAEVIAQMAVVGLAITSDTGQINTGSVTKPGSATAGGYSIFRFTDTIAKGGLATMNAIVGGSTYTNGTYTNVPLTGGTGSGAQATVVVAGTVVTTVTITTAGSGYLVCDQLSAAAANIGGTGSGFTAQVATLAAGAYPIVIKLEYGSNTTTTIPQLWVTVGQGTNGAGTLTGTTNVRCVAAPNTALVSTATSYTSRFCFNATQGFLGFCWKIGGMGTNTAITSILIGRSTDTAGATTGDAFYVLTGAFNTTPPTSSNGQQQNVSILTSTVYPTSPSASNNCAWGGSNGNATGMPFNLTSTTYSGNSYVIPCYYMTPNICISNHLCLAMPAEVPLGNSFTTTLVGSSSHTYIQLGLCFGNSNSLGQYALGASGPGLCMLWE